MNGNNLQQSQPQPQGHYIPTSGQNNIYPNTYVANSNKNIINGNGGATIQQQNINAMGHVVVPVIRGQ